MRCERFKKEDKQIKSGKTKNVSAVVRNIR